ncbi:MAG: sigma-70 family RNA polymerase sigma factor [Oligoflexia bacterium]|nr:sigma-70 family RNA polymerase sigma factor [Oligoflexia bacterium]
MNNELVNLSELIRKYQLQISDLITYSCILTEKKTLSLLLSRTYCSIYSDIRTRKITTPLHMFIYRHTIENIVNFEKLPQKSVPVIKELDNSVSINEYKLTSFDESELFSALKTLTPEERIILCLKYRHKLNIREISSLFKTTPGTIYSKILSGKSQMAEHIIKSKLIIEKNATSSKNSTCFFIKNLQSRYENRLLLPDKTEEIENHLEECKSCRNFYSWQSSIEKAFEKGSTLTDYSAITSSVFGRVSRASILKNALYFVMNNWTIRFPAFIAVIILSAYLINLSGVIDKIKGIDITSRIAETIQHQFKPIRLALQSKPDAEEKKTTDPEPVAEVIAKTPEKARTEVKTTAKQETATQTKTDTKTETEVKTQAPAPQPARKEKEPVKAPVEEIQYVYKYILQSTEWSAIDEKLKALLTANNARKAGQYEFGAENNGGSYYHFTLPDKQVDGFISEIEKIASFQLIKQKESRNTADNRLRFVIWIGRKSIEQ